mgnify:CR=1 FL=1
MKNYLCITENNILLFWVLDFFRFFNWKIRLVRIPIDHTENSRELIQEKIDGILEEYKMHKKEKMDLIPFDSDLMFLSRVDINFS